MLFSTADQLYVFLWMIGAGLLIGALYALFAGLRRLLCAGFWLTLLADAAFGLSAAAVFIAALVTASYGALRLYELAGAALGILLFACGLTPFLRRILHALIRLFRRIYDRICAFCLIKVIFK